MSESAPKPARRWWKYLLIVIGAILVCFAALTIYINTDSFQRLVRRRLVAEVERITGGRAEIGSVHTVPFRLQAEVRNITVHGRESATDLPLAHADAVVARLKVISLLESEFGFNELILEQPVLHLVFYPDGTTNVPQLTRDASAKSSVEQLFSLSIDRLEVRHGRMLWNDQNVPIDFFARDTSFGMEYSYLHKRYDGRLLLGLVDTKLPDCRPFAWMTSAEFTLSSDTATVTSFKWNSGHSNLYGNGQITDFSHPHLHATYNAHVDLTEAASIVRRPELRAGILELNGDGGWSIDQFNAKGLLTLRDLAWQDDHVSFAKASASTVYDVTDQQLSLSRLQGKIFGGSFSGSADLAQWLAPDQHLSPTIRKILETATISAAHPANKSSKPAPKPTGIQNASISLRLRDLSVENIALALDVPAHPLQSLHPAGLASGTLDTHWKGTRRDAEVRFDLNVTPPTPPEPPQLPLTAHASGLYYLATDTVDLPQFTLSTPTSHVQANGTLSSTSALHLSVSTSSLADWLPFVAAVRGPALFPVVLNGRATFNGNMTGEVLSPQLAGSLLVDDFEVNLPASGKTPEIRTQWDSFSSALKLSFNGISLQGANLRHDATSAEFDASASLAHGHLTGESTLDLRASLQSVDLAFMQAVAGYHYPITGSADVLVQATGTISEPEATGQIHSANATAYGQTIQQFDSNFRVAHGEVALHDLRLIHDDSVTTGSAAYNPATRNFDLNLSGNNFNLARIDQVQWSRLPLDGRADFTLKASGTNIAPNINADIHAHNLAFDRELFGDVAIQATTDSGNLRLTAATRLARGSVSANGTVRISNDYPADISFKIDQIDPDALWRGYFGNQLTGHSAATGTATLRGPLFQPVKWVFAGDLSGLSIDVENVKLHNQDQVRFVIGDQALRVSQLHMLGEGTDLAGHGAVQFSGALDFTADGRLDLKLLNAFDPNLTASGLATVNMTLGGSFDDPLPQGRIQFTDGSFFYATLPSGLNELNGSLVFTRDHVSVEALNAKTGGGVLALKGDATYSNKQLNFNLTASGKDVRLRYPPGVSSTADAELHWAGSRAASAITGNITINKIAVTPGFDFSSYLDRSRQSTTLTVANSPLYNIKLDVHVQTAPELQMRTAIARLSGDADLRLRGSAARPALLGRVDILEGQATFHGTHFTLERGDITFANPVSIEPQLNLQASTHVRNYDLNITVSGTTDRGLNLNYRSEPPLPKSDIIALLALGRTGDESSQLQEQSGQSAFTDQATALILDQALNSTVSSRFQRLFGASNIKIDPQGLTTETNPTGRGPQVTIEQEFANNLSLTYSTNVAQSSQQIIEGEYYFNRNLSVVGTRDQNGVVSFDVRVRRRKK